MADKKHNEYFYDSDDCFADYQAEPWMCGNCSVEEACKQATLWREQQFIEEHEKQEEAKLYADS